MSKISKYIFFVGGFLGSVIGGYLTYIGWVEDPMVFSEEPEYSIVIFLSWFIPVLFPFALTAGIFETYRFLRKKFVKK